MKAVKVVRNFFLVLSVIGGLFSFSGGTDGSQQRFSRPVSTEIGLPARVACNGTVNYHIASLHLRNAIFPQHQDLFRILAQGNNVKTAWAHLSSRKVSSQDAMIPLKAPSNSDDLPSRG